MEVPDPEISGTEEKGPDSEGTEQVAASDVLCFNNIFVISCIYVYVVYTYVYRADMKLKGHRNLSDIQYHKLPLLLESNIWGRVAAPVKTRAGSYQLEQTFILCLLTLMNLAGQFAS